MAYRQQMFHGLIFWTYTLLVGKVSELQPESYVRALIRRYQGHSDNQIQHGDLALNLSSLQVFVEHQPSGHRPPSYFAAGSGSYPPLGAPWPAHELRDAMVAAPRCPAKQRLCIFDLDGRSRSDLTGNTAAG